MSIRTRSWGQQAGDLRLTAYRTTWTACLKRFKGAVFLNDEIVILMQRTIGDARLSIARFKPDGGYVPNSFTVLGTPDDVDPRGMTLAGNQVFVLDAARLLALDRGFAYVQSENVAVGSAAPISVGWNGSALLVYDNGGTITFYGSEQAADRNIGEVTPAAPVPVAGVSGSTRKYLIS